MRSWNVQDFVSDAWHRQLLSLEPSRFDVIVVRYPQLAYYLFEDRRLRSLLRKTVIDVDDVLVRTHEREVHALPFGYPKLRKTIDLIIGAWCIAHRARLLHSDRDFTLLEAHAGLLAA